MHINQILNNIKTQNVIKALESLETQNNINQNNINLDNMLVEAKVLDILGEQITVKLPDGNIVSGKFTNNSNLNIGDVSKFIIKSNDVAHKETDNIVKNILGELDIKKTEQTEHSIKVLIKNNMQLTKENINELSIGFKKLGIQNEEKVLFMFKNKIPFTDTNIEMVTNYKDNNIKLSENVMKLTQTINKEPDVEVFIQKEKQNLFETELSLLKSNKFELPKLLDMIGKYKLDINTCKDICSKVGLDNKYISFLDTIDKVPKKEDINNFIVKIAKDFDIDLKSDVKLDVEVLKKIIINNNNNSKIKFVFDDKQNNFDGFDKEIVKDFFEDLHITSKILSEHPNKEVAKQAQEVKSNVEFFSKLKEDIFFQIPIKMNDAINDTDVYYFKEKTKTKKNKSIETALVSINTANLGLFETFIKKNDNAINIEFRLKDEQTNKLVKENINKLNELLESVNYKLEGYSFKSIDEKFNFIKEEEISELQEVKISKFDLKT